MLAYSSNVLISGPFDHIMSFIYKREFGSQNPTKEYFEHFSSIPFFLMNFKKYHHRHMSKSLILEWNGTLF